MGETDIVTSRLVARHTRTAGFFSLVISVPLTAISTVLLSASIIRSDDVSLDGLTVAVAFLISIASFIGVGSTDLHRLAAGTEIGDHRRARPGCRAGRALLRDDRLRGHRDPLNSLA